MQTSYPQKHNFTKQVDNLQTVISQLECVAVTIFRAISSANFYFSCLTISPTEIFTFVD